MNNNKKLIELKSLIDAAEISLQQARKIMVDMVGSEEEKILAGEAKRAGSISRSEEGQVIEGLFDGQNMVGPDGKKYSVPANYASKSKLVEGDRLKLTITSDGSFVYKQINLLERDRLQGELTVDSETSEFKVLANNKSYQVLTASITYFKGEEGDKVTILVPKGKESLWAAVENIYKAGQAPPEEVAKKEIPKVEEKKEEAISESTEEPKADEFLSTDTAPADVPKTDELQTAGSKPIQVSETESTKGSAPETKPEDIFEATEEVDTKDVKQVDLEPASTEQATADLINENAPAPAPTDVPKDNQGLEDI